MAMMLNLDKKIEAVVRANNPMTKAKNAEEALLELYAVLSVLSDCVIRLEEKIQEVEAWKAELNQEQ